MGGNRERNNFVLDIRSKLVHESDVVLFLQDSKEHICKVLELRCKEGNYEVRVGGPKGGWKRKFYKLANE